MWHIRRRDSADPTAVWTKGSAEDYGRGYGLLAVAITKSGGTNELLPKNGPLKCHKSQQIRDYTLNDVLHIYKNTRHGGIMDSQVPSETSEDEFKRRLDCEEAMEIAFARLLSDAVVAGWREMEVAVILADIADDHVLRLARRSKARKFN